MARRGRPPYPGLLTPREVEVLALLREGLTNESIAEQLGISLAGAKYHVSEILGKLGVETRGEAARWSTEGARARPWWAGVLAPIAFVWRKAGSGPIVAAGAGAVALLIAVGVGLLVWGLLRTGGGSASSNGVVPLTGSPLTKAPAAVEATSTAATPTAVAPTATVAPIGTVGTACPGGPTVPASSTPLFAYAAADKTIWVASADGATRQQLICDATGASNAAWSADGKYIAHAGDDGSLRALDVQTGENTVLDNGSSGAIRSGSAFTELQWSPTSDTLAYEKFDPADPRFPIGIWRVGLKSPPVPLVQERNVRGFAWSPDGQRIVYQVPSVATPGHSDKGTLFPSGELYLMNADGTGAFKLADGELYSITSQWSPDGRLLVYWTNVHGGSTITGDVHAI